MTEIPTPISFNCPNCGAPLEAPQGVRSMTCKYCQSSVVIPKPLRTRPRQTAPSEVNVSPVIGKNLIRLIIAGVSILVVGIVCLAVGVPVFFNMLDRAIFGSSSSSSTDPGTNPQTAMQTAIAGNMGWPTPDGYAAVVGSFGGKGIGQGLFEDARSITVDHAGNILVGDYKDGRIQTFSSTGKFLSSFRAGDGSGVRALTAGPDGRIYAVDGGTGISIYDASGKKLGSLDSANDPNALSVGPDGSLYATDEWDGLYRFDPFGKQTLKIEHLFESVLGQGESNQALAVDGLGNIYVVGDLQNTVVKYSPDGKYLDKFSGTAEPHGPVVPGTVFTACGLAVDSHGQVYLADWNDDFQIFDGNGNFVHSVEANTLGETNVLYGIAMDAHDHVYLTTGETVLMVVIKAP